jgi:hypothetical protein
VEGGGSADEAGSGKARSAIGRRRGSQAMNLREVTRSSAPNVEYSETVFILYFPSVTETLCNRAPG